MRFEIENGFQNEGLFMYKYVVCLLALMLALSAAALGEGGLSIVATDFPCYDFARQVAGEDADVTLLIRPGTEVHTYDPSPADLLAIRGADLFVYIGGESDVWVERILSGFGEGEAPEQLRMMDAVALLEEEGDEEHVHGAERDHEEEHGHEEVHDHGEDEEEAEYDEHIWTSPKNAVLMVTAMADALCRVDPENAPAYRRNAEDYIAQIDAIDAQIESIAAQATRRTLVVADRFPFLYLVRAYDLDYAAALPGCSAATEPPLRTILELIETVRREDVPVVYTIEMSTGSIAAIVSEETGAAVASLHSMQTVTPEEFEAGESYVSLMRRNVAALRRGLE